MKILIYFRAILLLVKEKLFENKTKPAKILQCGGYTISYTKSDSGRKKLLLIHGWAQSKKTWQKIVPKLEKEFTIYAIDLPGFGMSPRPSKPISLDDYATIVFLFTTQLGIHKFVLLGHSFGGKVATVFANKYPEQIEKIMLYSSGIGNSTKQRSTLLAQIIRFYLKLSSIPTLGLPLSFSLFDKTHKDINFSQNIVKIKQPMLLLYGKYDILAPIYQGKFLKNQITNAKLVIFNNSTHIAHKEEPEMFINELIKFVNDD